MARIGLIAGNGRFPFLVLRGALSMGHDVTVVAIKEEAFADLEQAESADFYRGVGALGRLFVNIETEAFALPA